MGNGNEPRFGHVIIQLLGNNVLLGEQELYETQSVGMQTGNVVERRVDKRV